MKHLNNHNDQLDEEQQETDRAVLENPPPVFIDYAEGGPEQLPELKVKTPSPALEYKLKPRIGNA
jgi:hypothetical protein